MNRTPMSQSYVNSQAGQEQSQQASTSQSQQAAQQQQQQQQQQQPQQQPQQQQQQQQQPQQQQPQRSQQQQIFAGSFGEQIPQLRQMPELTQLLLEFAFSVFINEPQDLVEFATRYFSQLRNYQSGQPASGEQVAGGGGAKRVSSDSQRSNLSQNSFNDGRPNTTSSAIAAAGHLTASEDELEMNEAPTGRLVNFNELADPQQTQRPKTSYNRRKSVFAEQYDPANDVEDDENNRVVHSKTDEQRIRLAKAIKSIFLFRSVDPQDMTTILDAMFEVKVAPGDVVIRQGDDGDNFYVIERGKFQIYVQQDDGTRQIRGEYEDNGFFGELALMYNQPRAATVVALSEGHLWAMDRNTFRRIVLKSAFKKRKEYEALFEKVSVLQCLNGYERMNLCDALESKRFLNGQMIIVQGDQANGMYFIESGNVKIVKQLEDGRVMDVAILGKGDYFGELALINHKPRAASVYALGDDVKLAFLDVKAFERLLGSCIERMEKNCAIYLSELAHNEGRQNV